MRGCDRWFRARPLHKLQAGVISIPTEATEVTWAHHTQVTCSQITANKYESLDSGPGQTQVHTLSLTRPCWWHPVVFLVQSSHCFLLCGV